jgi:hypothetical protein
MFRIEHNVETGEVIEIELSPEEVSEFEKVYANSVTQEQIKKAELEAKQIARQALLDKLGITEDEAKLLLGGN